VLIRAASDLHGRLPDIAPCDVLLLAGDLCPDYSVPQQRAWLGAALRPWLQSLDVEHVVAIAGNHDFGLLAEAHLPVMPWTYLCDREATVALGTHQTRSPWNPARLNHPAATP
jgi:3',5'-cyclic AMP phosphodiesterase CpdA